MKNLMSTVAWTCLAAVIAAPAFAAEAADQGPTLEEITVTATKTETNLQQTPIAISVVTAASMDDRHADSLLSLQDGAIPSLRVATFEARQSALTVGIRGIVPFDANQTARDQGVGVYIDGVYLGRQQGLNAALFDLERIEVLRGPQGTLFGRNTEGGALNIVTKLPSGKFGGRFSMGAGNLGSYNAEVHQDFEEFNGISVKVDGLIQHQGPITKNP
nr:TonB-dependent receptor [Phenylobacterium glaciei]